MRAPTLSILCLITCLNASADEIAQGLSVEQAYTAIPHARTQFTLDNARMNRRDAGYLDTFFRIVDVAVVERVETQLSLQSNETSSPVEDNYSRILNELSALETPERLRPAHELVAEAIIEQRDYLNAWRVSEDPGFFNAHDPRVRSAHAKLITAYRHLMTLYPNEGRHNKQAFYDHLCALDFI